MQGPLQRNSVVSYQSYFSCWLLALIVKICELSLLTRWGGLFTHCEKDSLFFFLFPFPVKVEEYGGVYLDVYFPTISSKFSINSNNRGVN